jgi:hypothetical protein
MKSIVDDDFICTWWIAAQTGVISWDYVRGLCHGIAMETADEDKRWDYRMLTSIAMQRGMNEKCHTKP